MTTDGITTNVGTNITALSATITTTTAAERAG